MCSTRFLGLSLVCLAIGLTAGSSPGQIHACIGKDLSGWRQAHAWVNVGVVRVDPDRPAKLVSQPGAGTLLNGNGRTGNLFTTAEFGDVEAHIEFMVPKGSNSGVYFQGRYEVQILDSSGKPKVGFGDCGGIYQRWRNGKGFEGHAPRVNASRAPGRWQTFDVVFRAPRFDAAGKKVRDAEFVRVVHNGVLVHEHVKVTGPTRAAGYRDEAATGPLMLQGDHGPVAYRNIRVRTLPPDAAASLPLVRNVEPQPFLAHAHRIREALAKIGNALPRSVTARLLAMRDEEPSDRLVAEVQRMLDRYCLATVEINPEARIKIGRGPAPAVLAEQGWRSFLVKVYNAGAITGELDVSSPNAKPALHRSSSAPRVKREHVLSAGDVANRFLELAMYRQRPMLRRLSGLPLEYAIVQVYTREAGSREARLGFHAGQGTADLGGRNAIDVLFDCRPAVQVELAVTDETGAPTTASFTITDGVERLAHPEKALDLDYRHRLSLQQPWDLERVGSRVRIAPFQRQRLHGVYPLPARRRVRRGYPDFFFQPQVYRKTGEHVRLSPGTYEFVVTRGPEYLPQRKVVKVVGNEPTMKVEFALERWVHLKKLGWYSVDHHVHAAGCSHYESPEEGVEPPDMWRQALGEDLNVACVLSWGPCWYHQKQNFDGRTHPLSQKNYLMRYDVEVSGFPSSHAGHLCLLNLSEDDYPGTERIEQWPSWTLPVLQWAKRQGGVTGYAHSGWGLSPQQPTDEFPNLVIPKYDSIGANEYIVTATHGVVDFISAGDTPLPWELNMWYHTLNVGLRTRISGETDFPCIFDERVGMCRSYVKVDGALDFAKIVQGIASGRSYVTDGKSHIVDFAVGDRALGEAGSELALAAAGTTRVAARVACLLPEQQSAVGRFIAGRAPNSPPYWDVERARIGTSRTVAVELVVNGQAVAKKVLPADGEFRRVEFEPTLSRSCWVALRVLYSAHTNPIFVTIGGQPIRNPSSARWCRDGVKQCWVTKSRRIRESERAAARRAYDQALAFYEKRM